jgi:hypothetical protein
MTNNEERDRILMADAVMADLKQFDKLRRIDPPISTADIANRMAWKLKDVKWLLKKMKDDRG